MRILIIEDFEPIAQAMQQSLRAQGHTVDWIIGAACLQPFVGYTNDKQPQPIDPSQYDLVLCDGDLFGSNTGPNIVSEISSKVRCVGISSQPKMNDEMKGNGAIAGFVKHAAFACIQLAAVPMQNWQQADAESVRQIESFAARLKEDRELRRQLDECIMRAA